MELASKTSPVTAGSSVPDRRREDREALLERILRNPRIPSPPTLALQVFQKTGQEDCTVAEISELLAHDPGLCAKILKTLNSAIYALAWPVTSVRQAVALLGNRPLRSLILGLVMPAMQGGVAADAGLRRFWKKSVTGAVMARLLALRCQMPAPNDDMAVSLLRDLGMMLLHQSFLEIYDPIWLGEGEIRAEDQCEWEKRCLGVNHAEVSAALLERWRLPLEFVEPIRYHHHPQRVSMLPHQLANRALLLDFTTRLTELEGCSKSATIMEGILRTARERYDLDRAGLELFLGEVRPKVEEFSRIMCVDIGDCPDFEELLVTGCEELVRVSVEAATNADPKQKSAEHGRPGTNPLDTADRTQEQPAGPGSLTAGSRLFQYEVVEVLGRGAMGIVYKALDPKLSRYVAIKQMTTEMAGSENARQRFALEARFAASLRHENVVAIYAVNELHGVPFLVMEYVNGSSLGQLLDDGRTFSVGEIARIGRQTALGLAAAHEARLIHRDIKPANILIEETTLRVRVADFGIARAIDEDFHLSQPGLLVGTPNFMSPEQVDGKALTAASDLFSLGSVLYILCTDELPFQAETMFGLLHAVAENHPTPIRELSPDIPEGLARIVEKLHSKNPADRPPSAAAVAESLQPWIAMK